MQAEGGGGGEGDKKTCIKIFFSINWFSSMFRRVNEQEVGYMFGIVIGNGRYISLISSGGQSSAWSCHRLDQSMISLRL